MHRSTTKDIASFLLALTLILLGFYLLGDGNRLYIDYEEAFMRVLMQLPFLAALIVIAIKAQREERYKRGWVRPRWKDIPLTLTLFATTVMVGVLVPPTISPHLVRLSVGRDLMPFLLMAIVTAATEELFFRSWLIYNLEKLGGVGIPALLISAIIFSIVHFWQGISAMVLALTAGVIYAFVFQYYRSIVPLIAAHAAHNIFVLISIIQS